MGKKDGRILSVSGKQNCGHLLSPASLISSLLSSEGELREHINHLDCFFAPHSMSPKLLIICNYFLPEMEHSKTVNQAYISGCSWVLSCPPGASKHPPWRTQERIGQKEAPEHREASLGQTVLKHLEKKLLRNDVLHRELAPPFNILSESTF